MLIAPVVIGSGLPLISALVLSTALILSTGKVVTVAAAAGSVCGNGKVEARETCDDGNTSDNDDCPADCSIGACVPAGETEAVQVSLTPPEFKDVAGVTILLDYPEEKVHLPGPPIPEGTITGTKGGTMSVPVHLGHALRETVAVSGNLPLESLVRVHFARCRDAGKAMSGDFKCTVLEAVDPMSNPMAGVTCTVKVDR